MTASSIIGDVDLVKALSLLIHDLRAPLSVAHGYLRLLKENRLSSADERDRALGQTIEALSKMSRLCADTSAYAAPASDVPLLTSLPLGRFVDDLRQAAEAAEIGAIHLDVRSGDDRSVRAADSHALVDSLSIILGATKRAAGKATVTTAVTEDGDALRVLMGRDEDHARLRTQNSTFDPWRGGHTIALPLACRTVAEARGRVWTLADVSGAVAISLPLEDSPS